MRSKRISNTVWFKHKYVTQPTLTPADMLVKALNGLTQALKGKSNLEGLEQIESLKRLKEILTNPPQQIEKQPQTAEPRVNNLRQVTQIQNSPGPWLETPTVTFDTGTKSPNKTVLPPTQLHTAEPRLQKQQNTDISKAIIYKPMPPKNSKLTGVPLARVLRRQQFNARTHQQFKQEHAQLIHNADTGEYLNYRQLLRDPKHKELWQIVSQQIWPSSTRCRHQNHKRRSNTHYKLHPKGPHT